MRRNQAKHAHAHATAAVSFRPGDVLTSSGLGGLIDASRRRQLRHLATVHGVWGVVAGLGVRTTPARDSSHPDVTVEPGALIDPSGRLRTLPQATRAGWPPRGAGPWRLLLGFPADDAPPTLRWARLAASEAPVDSRGAIELARLRADGTLDFSFRPSARRPGARASTRFQASTALQGSVPVAKPDDDKMWTALIDTSTALLSGQVIYLVMPSNPPAPEGASWSVRIAWNDAFILEATNWRLDTPKKVASDSSSAGPPTLPSNFSWIGIETGPADTTSTVSQRSTPMNGSNGDSAGSAMTTDGPSTPIPDADASAPFQLPSRPPFTARERLTAADLTKAIAFLDAAQNLHNRLLHDWGIAAGLGVARGTGSTGRPLRVEPGMAIDNTGLEFVLETAYQIDAPSEAEAGTSAWYLVLHASSEPGKPEGVLAWRDPHARSGPRVVQDGRDIVLASVTFKAGMVDSDSIDPAPRRPIRSASSPRVSAGTTGPGTTVWLPWYDTPPGKKRPEPTGVSTFVETDAADFVVIAQLAGTRRDANANRVYDGTSFVANPSAGGFYFVVLFPDGPGSWGVSSLDELYHLLDRLKDPMNWSVSWIAVTKIP